MYEHTRSGKIVPIKHRYTELGTGLCYQQNGQWMDSKQEIHLLLQGGAAATNGEHQAYFPGDITQGVIKLVTPDGKQLQSRPIGLSYDDGTNTVLIAVLTNSIGELASSNQVVYPNAFEGASASLRYTYTKAGFEQDVVVQDQLPSPTAFGLNLASTKLQVLTEFFDTNNPAQTATAVNPQSGLNDATLTFGTMKMVRGRAFFTGNPSQPISPTGGTPTYKNWLLLNGRKFLLEQVPYPQVAPQLQKLPTLGGSAAIKIKTASANSILGKVSTQRLLPPQQLAQTSTKVIQMAQVDSITKRGLVLDYVTLNGGASDFVFQGDSTYYVTGPFSISGTVTFEGGSVIKFAQGVGASIIVNNVVCQTGPFRPSVLTAQDDDRVGETISGSSGSPSGYYGDPALYGNGGATLRNFRISYAQTAVYDNGPVFQAGYSVLDSQILNCGNVFYMDGNWCQKVGLYNGLVNNVGCVFNGSAWGWDGGADMLDSTIANCTTLINDDAQGYGGATVAAYNSILANVANIAVDGYSGAIGDHNGFYNSYTFGSVQYTTNTWPFQTVGSGSFYLTANCSFRNVGSSNIWYKPVLADIAAKTTQPPTNYPGYGTWGPCVPRDTNSAPDLGYHYDPLDYLINATVSVNFLPGTAVGFGSLTTDNGDSVNFHGTATQPCWFVAADTVQEAAGEAGAVGINTLWIGAGGVSAQFTKFSALANTTFFNDGGAAYPSWVAANCEFYSGNVSYGNIGASSSQTFCFTNCLFWSTYLDFGETNESGVADNCYMENCLVWNGRLAMQRDGPGATWVIENTAFDGTSIALTDGANGDTNYTRFDHNAYLQGADQLPYDTSDVTNIISYNWQSNWFGNFYLPPNSLLIQAGSTNANLLGLYHFTTQTNQVPETNSIVDIGYHYVATDQYGNPLDTNGDGIPDYLEDADGNGLWNNDETNWALAILVQPTSRSVLQGSNVVLSVTAAGVAPLNYQWYFNSGALANATNATLTFNVVETNNAGSYYVIITNYFGSIISSVATVTVTIVPMLDSDYDGRSDNQEIADGTDPLNPSSVLQVQLAHWPFDNTNTWAGDAGQLPLIATNVVGVLSWSTNAVQIDTNGATLTYRDVETNGNANINLRSGTVQFWFRPDWGSTNAGGVGPQSEGRLIEIGTQGTTNGWWGLVIGSAGTNIYFATQTNSPSTLTTNLTVAISWAANNWHQIVLAFSTNNSALYLDGQPLLTNGLGTACWPALAVRSQGFSIGGSMSGTNQAKGTFDELRTFNYPRSPAQILSDCYNSLIWQFADPNNPSAGILNVWIDIPTNGATLY